MYKLPENIDPAELAQIQGTEGTFLHPIQDADGNWVISDQEWHSAEFQHLKQEYPELAAGFTQIEFKPIIYKFE